MTKSRSFREVEDEATAYSATLQANDERFRGAVHVQHYDGSSFFWDSSFAVIVDGDFLVVLTEHHRTHVFSLDDVNSYRWFPRHEQAPKAPWQ